MPTAGHDQGGQFGTAFAAVGQRFSPAVGSRRAHELFALGLEQPPFREGACSSDLLFEDPHEGRFADPAQRAVPDEGSFTRVPAGGGVVRWLTRPAQHAVCRDSCHDTARNHHSACGQVSCRTA